ncbi:hypothetical protein KY335_04315 [Candidatus Woesearchaeota archaeon]|nr:hypothetical protein [Candidatus Woesearchaeota archaeon]
MAITSRRIGVKKKERKFLLTALIVFLMVISVVGYAAYQWEDEESYNGYKFSYRNNYWSTKVSKVLFEFHYPPADAEQIELSGNLAYDEYFLVHDLGKNITELESSAIDLAKYELSVQMTEKMGLPVDIAVFDSSSEDSSGKTLSCSDATSFIGVVEYSYGNETKIVNEDNCIRIIAKSDKELIKANDRLLYGLLGII